MTHDTSSKLLKLCGAGWQPAADCQSACFVGQPILAAAAFQAASSSGKAPVLILNQLT
jgi:hypothetical protein